MRPSLDERMTRQMRRMLPGSFAGRSEQVSPVIATGSTLSTYRPTDVKDRLTFSQSPVIVSSTCGYDHLRESLQLIGVVLLGNTAVTSGSYTVRALKNPVSRSGDTVLTPVGAGSPDITLATGNLEATFTFLEPFTGADISTGADLVRFEVTGVGAGLNTLTFKALFG